jgi:hypothetical protein
MVMIVSQTAVGPIVAVMPQFRVLFGVHDNEPATVNGFVSFLGRKGIRCFAHTLQLAVRDALDLPDIAPLLKKARRIVVRFRRSTVLMKALEQQKSLAAPPERPAPVAGAAAVAAGAPPAAPARAQADDEEPDVDDDWESIEVLDEGSIFRAPERVAEAHGPGQTAARIHELQIPSVGRKLRLIIDVITRWNSTFYMIERLLVMKDFVTAALLVTRNALAPDTSADAPPEEREPLSPRRCPTANGTSWPIFGSSCIIPLRSLTTYRGRPTLR